MERDDLIIELARAIRPCLPELLGDQAQETDRQLADLLADLGAGGDKDQVRRAILATLARHQATHNWGGEFLAAGRPPGLQLYEIRTFGQVSGRAVTPPPVRYACPKGDYAWYGRAVGEGPPRCGTHKIDLVLENFESIREEAYAVHDLDALDAYVTNGGNGGGNQGSPSEPGVEAASADLAGPRAPVGDPELPAENGPSTAGERLAPLEVRGDRGDGDGEADEGGDDGEQPKQPMVTRVLRAEFPTRVRTGVSLTLIAIISEQRDGPGARSGLRPVMAGSNVMLTCSATGFDLRSEMQVKITIPASGDSDPAPFELVATDPGLQQITIRAFAGSSYLGALSIQVTVDSTGRTDQPTQHAAELSRREWEQGEVTLEIEYDADKKLYLYRWRDETFSRDVSFRNDEQLQRTPAEVVDGIVQELNTLARGTKGYSAESAKEWLKNQGIGLWQDFFPKRLQAQFRERWGKITRLSIISNNDLIPWELLYASDEEGELGYLAQHFPIARLPQGGVPPALRVASADFVRPPKDSPAAAAKEVEAVGDILNSRGVDVHTAATDLDSLRGLLAAGQFSLLHFASHNSFSRTPPFDKIILGKTAFDPSFLNQYKPRAAFRASSPLVFINACSSDRRTPIYTRLGGWADAFLDAGAGAFIGSLWEVRDSSSLLFATELYTALAEGKSVGESIALARKKLRSVDPSDPTWLAYSLWGDPAAKIRFGGGT